MCMIAAGVVALRRMQSDYRHQALEKEIRQIKEEFDNWYENIQAMSLYDTGVSAEFGDEFLTLSCCSYHTEDGGFVVVGKRVV